MEVIDRRKGRSRGRTGWEIKGYGFFEIGRQVLEWAGVGVELDDVGGCHW